MTEGRESLLAGLRKPLWLAGRATEPFWTGGGSHHSRCGLASGNLSRDDGLMNVCRACLKSRS